MHQVSDYSDCSIAAERTPVSTFVEGQQNAGCHYSCLIIFERAIVDVTVDYWPADWFHLGHSRLRIIQIDSFSLTY